MTGLLCPRCRCPVAKHGVCDGCWRELGGVVTAPYPLCEHNGCENEALTEEFRCMEHAAPDVRHECCPQAKANLRLMPSRSGRNVWRLHVPVADDSRLAAVLSVTYCPWCGVELEEWRRLQQRPRPKLTLVDSRCERCGAASLGIACTRCGAAVCDACGATRCRCGGDAK